MLRSTRRERNIQQPTRSHRKTLHFSGLITKWRSERWKKGEMSWLLHKKCPICNHARNASLHFALFISERGIIIALHAKLDAQTRKKNPSFSLLFFTGVTLLRVSLKASLESGDRGRTYLGKNAGTNWVILTPVEKQKSERVRYSGSQTGIYERSLGPIEERSIPPFERRGLAGPSHVRLAEFWGKFEARFSPSCRRFVRGLARKVDVANSLTWWAR